MRNLFLPAALLTAMFTTLAANAQTTLLALSKHDHTLAVVDPASLKVLYKLPVGPDPHEVIASTDGATAYVSNYGFGAYHTLAVLDLVHHMALPSIDLGPLKGPHGLAFVNDKVFFTAEGAKAIGSYNPATQKVDFILGTGQNRTHMIHVSPDVQHIITSNVSSGTISLIDMEPVHTPGPPSAPHFDWNQTVVPVGHGSEGFDLSPDNKEIWVANAQDGTISVIDYAAKNVIATLDVNVRSANRLKFTLDGKHVLVSLLASPDLVILDAATRKVIKRLPIGTGAAGMLMQPDGQRAFVACTPDNYIAVIDLHSLTVTGHIESGPGPDGLAWAVRQ